MFWRLRIKLILQASLSFHHTVGRELEFGADAGVGLVGVGPLGVGGIEGQTFLVRGAECETTCLRFDLTPTSRVVPGSLFLNVQ
jgi:hypothetical protein